MNLEISNEMIEHMIKEEVKDQVNTWFKCNGDRVIRDSVDGEVRQIVSTDIGSQRKAIDIKEIANSLGKELIANKCAESICGEIAYAFAQKFENY